jgi:hypothetical protein
VEGVAPPLKLGLLVALELTVPDTVEFTLPVAPGVPLPLPLPLLSTLPECETEAVTLGQELAEALTRPVPLPMPGVLLLHCESEGDTVAVGVVRGEGELEADSKLLPEFCKLGVELLHTLLLGVPPEEAEAVLEALAQPEALAVPIPALAETLAAAEALAVSAVDADPDPE